MTEVAAIQMVSTPVVNENIVTARRLIGEAVASGAEMVLLPEWPSIGLNDAERIHHAEPSGSGPIQDFMAEMSREYGIWLIGGTLSLVSREPGKVLNSSLVYNPDGENIARYDKICDRT